MSDFTPHITPIENETVEMTDPETQSLIAASKVEGTAVYDESGEKLGTIHDVMIEKTSGKVAYAVLSFGGFLGLGSDYYPIPWSVLSYSTKEEGYVVAIQRDRFKGAPSYASAENSGWMEHGYTRRIDDYYGTAIARGR